MSKGEFVHVPAFTDLKLHDITSGPDDFNMESLDMNQAPGSPGFFAGNRKFLTRKLWGVGTKPNYFHHGQFTTIRESILAHSGEALQSRTGFQQLSDYERDCLVEFLKSLQILPPGSQNLIIDETGHAKQWPPEPEIAIVEEGASVRLAWNGNTGIEAEARVFQVQQCHNLEDPTWEPLGVPTPQAELVVPKTNEPTFYRVITLN